MKNLHEKNGARWIVALFSLTAFACVPTDEEPEVFEDSPPTAFRRVGLYGLQLPPGVQESEGCPEYRMVGIRPPTSASCPRSGSKRWKRVNLFPHATSAALSQFCAYDWKGPGTPDPKLMPHESTGWLEPDCMSVTAFGHPYEGRNVAAFEQAFLTQVQASAMLPAGAAATKVVVVDTSVDAPFPNGGTGRSEHGRAVSAVIRKLACSSSAGSGCAAEVTTKLAMPLRRQNGSSTIIYDPAQGGWLGRASDIASATHRGLHDALRRSGPGRIIINLSLGWDGAWGGALAGGVSSLSLGQQMVYAALEEAACQEALVVAAVGNSAGYGSDGGPAYPAAWEKELAPTSARCAAFGLGGSGAPGGVYRPLLYAASAVDGQDQPLPSQRPGSLTRFAAPGGHVAISYGGWSSTLYTGTSMASAVVSAAAAVAWGYDPSLRPDQVMDLVHVAGANLATAPELCLGNACGGMNVKRVSLCATVRRSCNATNACGPVLCPARPPGRDDRPTGIDYSVPVGTTYLYRNATSFNPPAPCTGSVYAINSSSLDSACPFDEFLSRHVAPFGVPQPPINGCPNCGMNQNSVEIGVSDDVSGTLDDAVLNVTYTDGTEDQIALDNLGPLTGGDTVQIDVEDNLAGTVDQASIEFSYDGNYSSFSDLHVEN